MAVTPTFVADTDTLKQSLRLSGISTDSDAAVMLDAAIKEVRANFIRRLGLSRVSAIVAFDVSDNPSTNNETLRAIAEVTEVKWIKSLILRTFTHMSLSGASGNALTTYHEEAPFRFMGEFDKSKEITRLQAEIEENLQLLVGEETFTSESRGQFAILEPSETPPRPGESIWTFNE